MADLGVDYLAASGHKLYAPFGAGVLIGRGDWLGVGDPYLRGGGAVDAVTLDDVVWSDLPDRQEAGSPNVVGAVALGAACETLSGAGMGKVADDEWELYLHAREALQRIEGVSLLTLWPPTARRVGILTLVVEGVDHSEVAAVLSAEYGVGVRDGCFCAHPLMMQLLKIDDVHARRLVSAFRAGASPRLPGAVRLSLGLGSTREDVDCAAGALAAIARGTRRWTYERLPSGEVVPQPDPRPIPESTFLPRQTDPFTPAVSATRRPA
jgi:selenocysteine lyase/cysteine desulfurase